MDGTSEHPTEPAARRRVLLLAYACRPGHGSEAGVGWNRALQSARRFDTWVICEAACAGPIEDYFRERERPPGLRFVFVPTPRALERLGRVRGLYYMTYNLWHRRALRVARWLHAEIGFDLTHQVTFCGYREPGYLWKLGVPFIWGPVGGTQNLPWRFLGAIGPAGAASEAWRTLANHLQLRFSPCVRRAARRATLLLAANSTNQADFARVHGRPPRLLLETGVEEIAAAPPPASDPAEPLRLLWVGECRAFKALPLLLRALAQLPRETAWRLRVVGQGPALPAWRREADRLGLEQRITWSGWLPYEESLRQYREADVLVFTSLRDTSGNVMLEALADGVPVVCLDHQGARDIVTDRCGIKIPVVAPSQAIAGLRDAVARLAADRDHLAALRAAARERAEHYLWSRQGERMTALYHEVLREGEAPAEPQKAEGGERRAESQTARSRMASRGGVIRLSALRSPLSALPKLGGSLALPKIAAGASLQDFIKIAAGWAGVGCNLAFGNRAEERLGILVYHRVSPLVPGAPRPTMNVTPDRFERQLSGLLRRGYRFLPLREALRRRAAGERLPPRSVVVTFDDCFESAYREAWPVMRKLGVPGTMFVSTAYLGGQEPFPFDPWGNQYRKILPPQAYRPLTAEQCREMAADGLIEIGAHTHTHQDFRGRPEAFERDLRQSVEAARALTGEQAVTFAFPFGRTALGHASAEMRAAARRAGVLCALTTDAEPVAPASDPFGWPRFNAYQWDDARTLAAKFAGWYGWAPKLQERLRRLRSAAGVHKAGEIGNCRLEI